MRHGCEVRPNSHSEKLPSTIDATSCAIERAFRPTELDVDDLAEAIRSLLEDGSVSQTAAPAHGKSRFLSMAKGVTDVVEAARKR
jgi:hypothetical protein